MAKTKGRFDILVDNIYGTLDERVNRVSTFFRSDTVPGLKPETDEDKLQNYLRMKDDPQAWAQIIQQRGMKNAIKYNEMGAQLTRSFTKKAFKMLGSEVPEEFKKTQANPALIQALSMQFQQIDQAMNPQSQQPQPQPQQPMQQPEAAPPPQPMTDASGL